MSSKDVTLIIVSGGDIASTNQADFLLQKFDWKVIEKVEGLDAYSYQEIRMGIHPGGVLFEDDLEAQLFVMSLLDIFKIDWTKKKARAI